MRSPSFEVAQATTRACYDLSGTKRQWLRRIASGVSTSLRATLGVLAYEFDARDVARPHIPTAELVDGPAALLDVALNVMASTTEDHVRQVYRGNSRCMLRNQESADRLDRHGGVNDHGVADVFALNAITAEGRGCVVSVPLRSPGAIRGPARHAWNCVAEHLAAGYNLRHPAQRELTALHTEDSAIVGVSTNSYSASGSGRPSQTKDLLRAVARAVDRSAAQGLRPDSDADLWTEFVKQQWVLVDTFEENGRRFLIARRSTSGNQMGALTARELEIARWLAQGTSVKVIALELGISVSTVSTHIRRMANKLGMSSRLDLVRVLRPLLA